MPDKDMGMNMPAIDMGMDIPAAATVRKDCIIIITQGAQKVKILNFYHEKIIN